MKALNHLLLTRFILILGLILGCCPLAFAQGTDIEPNNVCTEAQEMGEIQLPFVVDGSLSPPEESDYDFFRFTGQAGLSVRVDYVANNTDPEFFLDPFLGLFDSACNLLVTNDDSGGSLNSRLTFAIPADGTFILAAGACCDDTFSGQHNSSGAYQLTIAPPPPSVSSISGRVVNAVSGVPLAGDAPPFAFVDLLRCFDGDCSLFVNSQSTDGEGQFRFDEDFDGNPVDVGTYQVVAFAEEGFASNQSDLFDVGENEDFVTDIPLQPPPVRFSEIRPCDDLPPKGGRCRYSVKITNDRSTALRGAAWSLVSASPLGSPLDFTTFQAGRRNVNIAPGRSKVVRFNFNVPDTVRNDAFIGVEVYLGQRPQPFFDTVAQRFLFSIEEGFVGNLRILAEDRAQGVRRRSNVNARSLRRQKEKGMMLLKKQLR